MKKNEVSSFPTLFKSPAERWEKPGKIETKTVRLKSLEQAISAVQSYYFGLNRVETFIKEMFHLAKDALKDEQVLSETLWQEKFQSKKKELENFVTDYEFKRKKILNGVFFPQLATSSPDLQVLSIQELPEKFSKKKFFLQIQGQALPHFLIGSDPCNLQYLAKETALVVKQKEKNLRFSISGYKTVQNFLRDFQKALILADLNVRAEMNQGYLYLYNTTKGNLEPFFACSEKTRILSFLPGAFDFSEGGVDLSARTENKPLGCFGNYVEMDEKEEGLGCVTFYVQTLHSNHHYFYQWKNKRAYSYLDAKNQKQFLIFPSLKPDFLALGIENKSRFSNLQEIKLGNFSQRLDSVKILQVEMKRLENSKNYWRKTSTELMTKVMSLLFLQTDSLIAKSSSKKIQTMAEQIKKFTLKTNTNNPIGRKSAKHG